VNVRGAGSHAAARVEAQAKLNLFLRVLDREASGYHQLETLFQRIALADTVAVRVDVAGRSLDCRGSDVGPVGKNLAWRAANAFATAAGWPDGFRIDIEKRIPVGGGLGGGSADAAAVLRVLNALAPRPLAEESLAVIAFGLGADVPYLLSEYPLALGTGRGERLVALGPLPARVVMLLVPPLGVSSNDAFVWHDALRGDGAGPVRAPLLLPAPLSWYVAGAYASNDLEAAVFARHPELAELRDALARSGARIARMTGSGSTLFGVYDPAADREELEIDAGVDLRQLTARLIETETVQNVAEVELL
jgi:4-diphosphocytidyl-2-C-methyl-D-erythritol kinase